MSEPQKRFINTEFTMSLESYDKGWNMPYTHYHNDYEIYILESGVRSVKIADKEYVTAACDAALFTSNIPHKSSGISGFSGICIHFSERYLSKHLTAVSRQFLLKCFESPVIHLSQEAFDTIKQYALQFSVSRPENFVILTHILSLLTKERDNYSAQSITTTSEPDKETPTKARKIFSYVEENYASIRNLAELSKTFTVSDSYIYKIYQKKYNRTPKQYINELRINNACHRLQNTDATIARIAAECGYDCYEYFIRVFKSIKKCTPSEFRKSARM